MQLRTRPTPGQSAGAPHAAQGQKSMLVASFGGCGSTPSRAKINTGIRGPTRDAIARTRATPRRSQSVLGEANPSSRTQTSRECVAREPRWGLGCDCVVDCTRMWGLGSAPEVKSHQPIPSDWIQPIEKDRLVPLLRRWSKSCCCLPPAGTPSHEEPK